MKVFQHFREDERSFVEQVLEWQEYVHDFYAIKRTDFLDPREQEIAEQIIGKQNDVKISFWGGSEYAERKRAIFYPDYYEPSLDDYGLMLYQVRYPSKFISIEHRDLLGALMGIGLKRLKFGDILIRDNNVQVVVAEEIAEFVEWNLESVGRSAIKLEQSPFSEIIQLQEKWDEQTGTVSSMRLDAILSEIYHLSRSKVIPYIQSGLVKVNWKRVESSSYECEPGDYLSVRGLGRSKIIEVSGKTKKDKCRIVYGRK
ncbi:RNA-binding protein [Bacillus taeanensis]|uniref:RNA-binding protein n=1 Tax=Bacillus taeanensis TaxID=273032 RepID=A0A366XN75_9BACI|nr:RNA-binding protein [Bacillus taeanensis]RBW67357.1 RNA-binding protein [Bacillus taeanensis]